MENKFNNVERTIISATDSENLVKKLVSDGNHSEEIHNIIKSNFEHLEIILNREGVKELNSPKLVNFQETIKLGRNFISNYSI